MQWLNQTDSVCWGVFLFPYLYHCLPIQCIFSWELNMHSVFNCTETSFETCGTVFGFLLCLTWPKNSTTESRFGTFDLLSSLKAYVTLHSGTITLLKIKEIVIILSLANFCALQMDCCVSRENCSREKKTLWLLFSAFCATVTRLDRMINKLLV